MSEADRIVEAAFDLMSSYRQKPKDLESVGYKGTYAIMRIPYDEIVPIAIEIRRRGICDNRADSVEVSFDRLLEKKTERAWERTGEVQLDRAAGYAKAFCVSLAKEALAA